MNTKKLLGWALLVLQILIAIYIILMLYGWDVVIKIFGVVGAGLGIFGIIVFLVFTISLISGE